MTQPRYPLLSALTFAALLCAGAAAAAAAPTAPAGRPCFLSRDWEGWSAPGDGDALLLRINSRDVYRVELIPGSHARKDGDTFLVNRVRGSNWICSHLDLDLTLNDHSGIMRQPLIAKSLRKLTPQEIAAIPRKDLP